MSTMFNYAQLDCLRLTQLISCFSFLPNKLSLVLISLLTIFFVYRRCCQKRRAPSTSNGDDNNNVMIVRRPPTLPAPGWPVLGHIPFLGRLPHRTLATMSDRHGPVLTLRLGTRRAVAVSGNAAVRSAFAGGGLDDRPNFESYRIYAAGRSISFQPVGPGLGLHRRIASNAIRRLVTSGVAEEVVRREADALVAAWLAVGGRGKQRPLLDPAPGVTRAIGAAIYSMCYGVDARLAEDEEYTEILTAQNPGTELLAIGHQADLVPRLLRRLYVDDVKQRAHVRQMTSHVRLNADKTQRRLAELDDVTSGGSDVTDGCCVLDAMIATSRGRAGDRMCAAGLSRDHLTGMPIEFLSAGTETSSATLLWLLLYMAIHPHVQERVHAELDQQLAPGDTITYDDRRRLPYTEAVILETMRLAPAVPLALPHYTRNEVHITGTEWSVPADSVVISNLWSTGHDAAMWKNPEVFHPERFLSVTLKDSSCIVKNSNGTLQNGRVHTLHDLRNNKINGVNGYKTVLPSTTPNGCNGFSRCFSNNTNGFNKQVPDGLNCPYGSIGKTVEVAIDRKMAEACLPFGVGRRRCVGEPLGRLQVFMFFVTIMRSCRVVPTSELSTEEAFGDVIKPQPYNVQIVDRLS